jgi:hypothetical protein
MGDDTLRLLEQYPETSRTRPTRLRVRMVITLVGNAMTWSFVRI